MGGCVRGLRCAPVAQIRGGFIKWEWGVCESGLLGEITVCICLFLEKTEHSILYQFF